MMPFLPCAKMHELLPFVQNTWLNSALSPQSPFVTSLPDCWRKSSTSSDPTSYWRDTLFALRTIELQRMRKTKSKDKAEQIEIVPFFWVDAIKRFFFKFPECILQFQYTPSPARFGFQLNDSLSFPLPRQNNNNTVLINNEREA